MGIPHTQNLTAIWFLCNFFNGTQVRPRTVCEVSIRLIEFLIRTKFKRESIAHAHTHAYAHTHMFEVVGSACTKGYPASQVGIRVAVGMGAINSMAVKKNHNSSQTVRKRDYDKTRDTR